MVEVSSESDYLTAQFCIDKLCKNVIILNEGAETEKEFQGKKSTKLEITVQMQIPNGKNKIWSMNQTSKRTLIKIFGTETKLWIGKTASLQFVDVQGKTTIYVDELGTRALNTQQTFPAPPQPQKQPLGL